MNINFREPSTKRAIVWIIGGVVVLVQIIRGQAVDADALLNRIDTWIGVAMTIAGLFGWLPDAPVEKPKDALPPIELQAQPTPAAPARQLHATVPPRAQARPRSVAGADAAVSHRPPDEPGWNG